MCEQVGSLLVLGLQVCDTCFLVQSLFPFHPFQQSCIELPPNISQVAFPELVVVVDEPSNHRIEVFGHFLQGLALVVYPQAFELFQNNGPGSLAHEYTRYGFDFSSVRMLVGTWSDGEAQKVLAFGVFLF